MLPSLGVYTLTCPGCQSRYSVSTRTIVASSCGMLLGVILGLPLWYIAVEAFHPGVVEVGVVIGLLAACVPGFAAGSLAGRLALRLLPAATPAKSVDQ